MVPLLVVWGLTFLVVPEAESAFKTFGIDPPFAARTIFQYYPYGFIFSFLVIAVWSAWPQPVFRGVAAFVFGLIAALLLGFSVTCALNAPLLELGAVIG